MRSTNRDIANRAAGAVLGGFVGEALGVGTHWYYDLAELRRDHGEWVSGYTTPLPGRYHDGLVAGQLSQAGIIAAHLLDTILECGGYDEAAFTARLDQKLFPAVDGVPVHGPGGYTSQSIRQAWRRRVVDGRPWGEVAGHADTTEAAERIFVLAVLYAADPTRAAQTSRDNARLTQNDTTIVAMTTAFACVAAALVRGDTLDGGTGRRLLDLVKRGRLPFHAITSDGSRPPSGENAEGDIGANFPSPDALIGVGAAAGAALDPAIRIEPAWKVAQVYGLPCAAYFQFPTAYYLAARFSQDFEAAVLNAINGGGQNQARAMLTGALVGAQVGIDRIPRRFIDGLERGAELEAKARSLGALAAGEKVGDVAA